MVAPIIVLPSRSQRTENVGVGVPVHEPSAQVRTSPTASVPEITGGKVLTGARAVLPGPSERSALSSAASTPGVVSLTVTGTVRAAAKAGLSS